MPRVRMLAARVFAAYLFGQLGLLAACGARTGLPVEGQERDASAPPDASVPLEAGADAESPEDGGCGVAQLGGMEPPPWATMNCPAEGCPPGSVCVSIRGPVSFRPEGCAPIPTSCGGVASCACMGCVCGQGLVCNSVGDFECQSLAP